MPTTAENMTFTSLVADIKSYLERGSLRDEQVLRMIPRIINNSERSLADKLKIQGYLKVLKGTMMIGSVGAVIEKPTGWRNTVSINIGTGLQFNIRQTLRLRSYEYVRACFPNAVELGTPILYCDYELNHWFVAPSPSQEFPFEANCYMLPNLLDDTNEQNYLTKFCPFLLLYECLTNMEPYLRNDERMPMWKSMRDEQLKAINFQDLQKVADRSIEREHA